jgi:hypothetical protein
MRAKIIHPNCSFAPDTKGFDMHALYPPHGARGLMPPLQAESMNKPVQFDKPAPSGIDRVFVAQREAKTAFFDAVKRYGGSDAVAELLLRPTPH